MVAYHPAQERLIARLERTVGRERPSEIRRKAQLSVLVYYSAINEAFLNKNQYYQSMSVSNRSKEPTVNVATNAVIPIVHLDDLISNNAGTVR